MTFKNNVCDSSLSPLQSPGGQICGRNAQLAQELQERQLADVRLSLEEFSARLSEEEEGDRRPPLIYTFHMRLWFNGVWNNTGITFELPNGLQTLRYDENIRCNYFAD